MRIDYEKKFNDPVASKTSWQPLRKGGASFKTYSLVNVSPSRAEFRSTWYAILFYVIFIGLGLGLLISSLINLYLDSFSFENLKMFELIAGIIFLVVGLRISFNNIRPIVFDKTFGYYWIGYKKPHYSSVHQKPDLFFRMYNIHALQLVSELVKGDKRSYYSYELNIVYGDGSRKNIVDHGNIEKLRKEAEELSRFINKPLWSDTRKIFK